MTNAEYIMKIFTAILLTLCCIICSCSKQGKALFKGSYSFKTGGSVDLNMETAWEELQVKEEALRLADETLRSTRSKFDAGMATASELMQVSLQRVQAAESLNGQQIKYRNAVRAYLSRFPEE